MRLIKCASCKYCEERKKYVRGLRRLQHDCNDDVPIRPIYYKGDHGEGKK